MVREEYWTKERVLEDAKRFSSREEWMTFGKNSHGIACSKRWLREAYQHMVDLPRTSPAPIFLDDSKKCSACKKNKNILEFYKDKSKKDNMAAVCKICHDHRNKGWRKKNPEKVRAYEEKTHSFERRRDRDLKRTYGISIKKI